MSDLAQRIAGRLDEYGLIDPDERGDVADVIARELDKDAALAAAPLPEPEEAEFSKGYDLGYADGYRLGRHDAERELYEEMGVEW